LDHGNGKEGERACDAGLETSAPTLSPLGLVKVLAVDTAGVNGGPDTITITVQVTRTQAKVLALLNEDGVEFGVKLRPVKKDMP
jgi:hypothetical protein